MLPSKADRVMPDHYKYGIIKKLGNTYLDVDNIDREKFCPQGQTE